MSRLSKRIISSIPSIQNRIKQLKEEVQAIETGGVQASFSVYKNHRDPTDTGGMIGDLARVVKYKQMKKVAQQELDILESVKSEDDWKKAKEQANKLREWRSDSGAISKLEHDALNKLFAEYHKRCPRQDKPPHEVLGVKIP